MWPSGAGDRDVQLLRAAWVKASIAIQLQFIFFQLLSLYSIFFIFHFSSTFILVVLLQLSAAFR